jgi:hypothetical protein
MIYKLENAITPNIRPEISMFRKGMSELQTINLLVLLMLSALSLIIIISPYTIHAYGQVSTNGIKTWVDKENNIKILLRTTPDPPTIGTPSVLRFTVQNLQTGKHVPHLLAHVVILGANITNREATFQLNNISAVDGDFSINLIFPAEGSYQVITKVTSSSKTHDVASLASFIVVVPTTRSAGLNFSEGNYIIWIGLLVASAVGAGSFLIVKMYSKYS